MKISYIIPAYNASASIARCIEHIINQRGDFEKEIIVVNDGSVDETAKIVEKYPVKLLNRPHLGASATRNYGLDQTTGDYIVFVDSDTFLDLYWTTQCLREDSATYDILVTTDLKYHEESPNARQIRQNIEKNPYVTIDNLMGFIGNGTFFAAKYKKFIRYDEMYVVGGEDIDILLRILKAGLKVKIALAPSFLHKHKHRSDVVKIGSFIRKKVLFAYGNLRTGFKHADLNSDYVKRDALNNFWVLPLYPFIALYVLIRNYFLEK